MDSDLFRRFRTIDLLGYWLSGFSALVFAMAYNAMIEELAKLHVQLGQVSIAQVIVLIIAAAVVPYILGHMVSACSMFLEEVAVVSLRPTQSFLASDWAAPAMKRLVSLGFLQDGKDKKLGERESVTACWAMLACVMEHARSTLYLQRLFALMVLFRNLAFVMLCFGISYLFLSKHVVVPRGSESLKWSLVTAVLLGSLVFYYRWYRMYRAVMLELAIKFGTMEVGCGAPAKRRRRANTDS